MRDAYIPCPSASAAFTLQEEQIQIVLAQANCIEAQERLLAVHLPCIRTLAHNFGCPNVDAEELCQAGCLCFGEKIIPQYDPRHKVRLWTYAHRVVWTTIRDACAKWHHLSDEAKRRYAQVMRGWEQFTQAHERIPTAEQLAEWIDLDVAVVRSVLEMGQRESSLSGRDDDETEENDLERKLPIDESQVDEGLKVQDRYAKIIEILGEHEGVKWIAWFALVEKGCTAEEIMALLGNSATGQRVWTEARAGVLLPPSIPADWAQICWLFHTPPPPFNNNLRYWYVRRRNTLKDQLIP